MTTAQELQELIAALERHWNKVQSLSAFLKLKVSEARQGGAFSYQGFIESKEEYENEKALLAGHALLVQEALQKSHINPSADVKRLLDDIRAKARFNC